MPIEPAGFISELDPNNPDGLDDYATADDHLRLLKLVLQAQFPNFDAQAMNALIEDLNVLVGADANGLTPAKLAHLVSTTIDLEATGTFTASLSGMTAPVEGTVSFVRSGHLISLFNASGANIVGESNSTELVMAGLPAALKPASGRTVQCITLDDFNNKVSSAVIFVSGAEDGEIHFSANVGGAPYTASGTKGLPVGWVMTYPLDP